jgi:2-polyprenyl-3-methyl-5-hydroxy-6-metoxy-1,4-benzoquinol methylase
MKALTEKTFWEKRHEKGCHEYANSPARERGISLWRLMISDYNLQAFLSLVARKIPPDPTREILEIGSAPGEMLLDIQERLGGIPYGVEYSEVGVDSNRQTFAQNGFPPQNVIHADFFSHEFLSKYIKKFGLVFSRGFIEHFSTSEMENVINHHISLVKDGGYLLISIPNLTGFRGLMTRLFNNSLIPLHNLEIMRLGQYRQIFSRPDLETIFCDYLGVPDIEMPTNRCNAAMRILQKLRHHVQLMIHFACYCVFRGKVTHNCVLSPDLVFIGKVSRSPALDRIPT